MSRSHDKPHPPQVDNPFTIIRGEQADTPLNVAIVGGGNACRNLLAILDDNRLSRLNMTLLGVSDTDPDAPGFRYAKELGLFTTTNLKDLLELDNVNLIIELTGSSEVRDLLFASRPSGVSILDHVASRIFWDLLQIETEKTELEKERKRYELKSRKKTQVILDSLPYRIMVVNMDMIVDTVNQTFVREFNIDQNSVEGKHCYELRYDLEIPCNEAGRVCFIKDHIQEIKEKGIFSTIREFIDKDGATRYDIITIAPIFNEKGDIVQILEASRDITERVKLEKEVEKSNTFFENMIQSTVDGIVVVDPKGNVVIFNEGMEHLTGYSAEEMIRKGHLTLFYDMDIAKENMAKMRTDQYGPVGKLNPTSLSVKTKDGDEIPVTLSASIIKIDGKEI